jgi:hypothetical protein
MTFINLLPLMLSRGACVPAAVDVRDHVSFQTLHPILDAHGITCRACAEAPSVTLQHRQRKAPAWRSGTLPCRLPCRRGRELRGGLPTL